MNIKLTIYEGNNTMDVADYTPTVTLTVVENLYQGGGTAQIQSDWNQTDNTKKDYIKNKPTIPSISGLATEDYVDTKVSDAVTSANGYTDTAVSGKVDKVTGKGLSTNDLTDILKTAYDGAVAWIINNGTNILNHLSNTNNPHSVTAAQIGAAVSANTVQCIGINTTPVSLTNNATEQIMHVIEIPAGTINVNDILRFESLDNKLGTSGNTGMRLRVSDTPNPSPISSATLLATWSGANTAVHIPMNRSKVFVKSSTSTLFTSPSTSIFDDNATATAFSSVNIDWTTTKYFIFTCQMGSANADVITKQFSKISK